jgi:hypothetical protein
MEETDFFHKQEGDMKQKLYCEDAQKKIDTKGCCYRAKNKNCQKCSYSKPLIEKPVSCWFKESYPFFSKAFQKHYKKDHNPVYLIHCFTEAVRYNLDIPPWVIKRLNQAFQEYLYNVFEKEEHRSLDKLLGCKKGKGQSPASVAYERMGRDIEIMTDMATLMRQGLTDADAAKVAYEHNIGSFSPNPERIRKDYYNDGWKSKFDEVIVFPERAVKSLLKFAQEKLQKYYTPEALRKKYPNIAWG